MPWLLARVTDRLGFLDLFDDPTEVAGLRSLQWRVLYIRFEVLQPQLLADGQHVPVVLERGHGGGERTAQAHSRLLADPDCLLEGIAVDVLDQSEVERDERHDPSSRPALRHRVVHLPVFVPDRGRRCSREVEEVITRRVWTLALQEVSLVDAVERRLDNTGVRSRLDLLLQPVSFGPPAMSANVGSQSRAANNWLITVPGWMCPGHRMTQGAR